MYSLLDESHTPTNHLVRQDPIKMYCLYCTLGFTTYFQQYIKSLLAFGSPIITSLDDLVSSLRHNSRAMSI